MPRDYGSYDVLTQVPTREEMKSAAPIPAMLPSFTEALQARREERKALEDGFESLRRRLRLRA
jgi:hypothetical protein